MLTHHNRWPHGPCHIFNSKGTYFITGSTLHKHTIFNTTEELNLLQNLLFASALKYEWRLEAWAIFSNHYHIIAHSPNDPQTLKDFIKHFHATSAIAINKMHNQKGRQVWHQYRDTFLSYEKSYFARLNYVMNNPVKHGIVKNAEDYDWCSKSWFNLNVSPARSATIMSFKYDTVTVEDDF